MATLGQPCVVCGKTLTDYKNVSWVELLDGGARYGKVGEPKPDETDPGYMAWHPVGSDCAKKLKQQGVFLFKERVK